DQSYISVIFATAPPRSAGEAAAGEAAAGEAAAGEAAAAGVGRCSATVTLAVTLDGDMTTRAESPPVAGSRSARTTREGHTSAPVRTYQVRTYGCQMTLHDSERITGLLEDAGYVRHEGDGPPDLVVFNTCAV